MSPAAYSETRHRLIALAAEALALRNLDLFIEEARTTERLIAETENDPRARGLLEQRLRAFSESGRNTASIRALAEAARAFRDAVSHISLERELPGRVSAPGAFHRGRLGR